MQMTAHAQPGLSGIGTGNGTGDRPDERMTSSPPGGRKYQLRKGDHAVAASGYPFDADNAGSHVVHAH